MIWYSMSMAIIEKVLGMKGRNEASVWRRNANGKGVGKKS